MGSESEAPGVLLLESARALESFASTVRAALCVTACRGLTDAQLASGAVAQAVGFFQSRNHQAGRAMRAETLPLRPNSLLLCTAANVATWMAESARRLARENDELRREVVRLQRRARRNGRRGARS